MSLSGGVRRFRGSPQVVAATLISLLTELDCQLRSVEEFGTAVTFTCPAPYGWSAETVTARVRPEGDGCAVELVSSSPRVDTAVVLWPGRVLFALEERIAARRAGRA